MGLGLFACICYQISLLQCSAVEPQLYGPQLLEVLLHYPTDCCMCISFFIIIIAAPSSVGYQPAATTYQPPTDNYGQHQAPAQQWGTTY